MEHDLAMEKMKVKMVDLRQTHLIELEEVRRQHEEEVEQMYESRRRVMCTAEAQVGTC